MYNWDFNGGTVATCRVQISRWIMQAASVDKNFTNSCSLVWVSFEGKCIHIMHVSEEIMWCLVDRF